MQPVILGQLTVGDGAESIHKPLDDSAPLAGGMRLNSAPLLINNAEMDLFSLEAFVFN